MKKEFIIQYPPFKECHASTLVELNDGNIFAAWFAGTKEGNNDVAIWGAFRYENGWSRPMCLAKVNEQPHWNPVLFRSSKGELFLYFKVGKNCSHWHTMVMNSKDDGKTWSKPTKLIPGNAKGRGPVKNKCIELSNGSWLAPASSEIGFWKAFVDISHDNGATWKKHTVPIDKKMFCNCDAPENMPQSHGVIQPTLWESKPGAVHMLLRSSCGKICRSDSNDYGETWCKVYKTSLPNNNSGIDLDKFRDGTILLTFNPVGKNWGARFPMSLAISEDNGQSWQFLSDIDSKKREYSYPAVIVTSDGGAAISYTWGRQNIVFIKLTESDLKNMKQDKREPATCFV